MLNQQFLLFRESLFTCILNPFSTFSMLNQQFLLFWESLFTCILNPFSIGSSVEKC